MEIFIVPHNREIISTLPDHVIILLLLIQCQIQCCVLAARLKISEQRTYQSIYLCHNFTEWKKVVIVVCAHIRRIMTI